MTTNTMDIDRALTNQALLGAALGDPKTWLVWLIVLRAAMGLPLTNMQQIYFLQVSGGRDPPSQRVRELWCVISRRCGKSRMAAALAVYFALFMPYKAAAGERPMVLVLAATTEQAKAVFAYTLGFLEAAPALKREIRSTTAHEIRLKNGVVIGIHANSFRSVRGRTVLAAICDEISFWRDETSATPDIEAYRAILPALATSKGMLIGISTPYRKAGLLYTKHKEFFGKDSNDTLIIQGTYKNFNLTLDEAVINAQREADAEGARSEWDADFRIDVTAFLDDELIEASIDYGRPLELPPQPGINYTAHVDPSGGRGDAFVVSIGHVHSSGRLIVDCIRGKHVPIDAHSFDPTAATREFAELLKQYRISSLTGDAYSAEWCAGAFSAAGIYYRTAEQNRSEIYLESLPLFTRGVVSLPDHKILLRELRMLERHTHRSGKDSVDHGQSGHDDYSNACCGLLVQLAKQSNNIFDSGLYSDHPPGADPEAFKHVNEVREYWDGLSAHIYRTTGHHPRWG
jgi:hypothetical protein